MRSVIYNMNMRILFSTKNIILISKLQDLCLSFSQDVIVLICQV